MGILFYTKSRLKMFKSTKKNEWLGKKFLKGLKFRWLQFFGSLNFLSRKKKKIDWRRSFLAENDEKKPIFWSGIEKKIAEEVGSIFWPREEVEDGSGSGRLKRGTVEEQCRKARVRNNLLWSTYFINWWTSRLLNQLYQFHRASLETMENDRGQTKWTSSHWGVIESHGHKLRESDKIGNLNYAVKKYNISSSTRRSEISRSLMQWPNQKSRLLGILMN